MRASVWRWFGVLLMVAGGLSHADTYEYDEVGNLKTLSSPRGTRTYTYDEVDRLDTEAGFTGSRNHAYDVNGNRTTDAASAPGTPTTATYTSNTNRIVTINGAAVSLDAAGQITNDGLNSYTWDDAGRLKTVSRAGQLRATYHYDHKHRRTRKVSTAAAPQGAKTIVYHYDDRDRLMAETSDTGVPIRSYAWADENLISQVEYAPNATNTGYDIARILYFELDQLGTPRQARERVGTIVWRWESDGYGTTAANEDPDGNGQPTTVNLRFPGQYYDEESGLHYNWHRYYVPRLGRYLSSDPIGIEGGSNTFAYVHGNPLRYTDPRGLDNPSMGPYGPGKNPGDGTYGPTQAIGAVGDFWRNYQDMRDANTIGGDGYFHCMANCQATRRGPTGESVACNISDAREWTDQNIKGSPASASAADQAANVIGRNGALSSSQSCREICSGFRPNGLPANF
jgi:RHS repeat-associated protein